VHQGGALDGAGERSPGLELQKNTLSRGGLQTSGVQLYSLVGVCVCVCVKLPGRPCTYVSQRARRGGYIEKVAAAQPPRPKTTNDPTGGKGLTGNIKYNDSSSSLEPRASEKEKKGKTAPLPPPPPPG
jgi:hypothetical protein